jgi:hypothetical protein
MDKVAASVTAPGALQPCNGATTIGSQPASDGDFFPGLIDEVYFLDHALSAEEIRTLYRGSGPLLALPFDQAWVVTGALLNDDSGWGGRPC